MVPDVTSRQEVGLVPIIATEISTLAVAYATVNPRLFPLRVWLVSIALASTWNLCTKYAFIDPWMNTFNFGICVAGITTFMKLVEITLLHEPPKYKGSAPCSEPSLLCKRCLRNAFSYISDIKCMYWDNDSPCAIPQDNRSDASHIQFYTQTFSQFLKHFLIYDTLHAIIESIGTLGTPQGDTIYRRTFAITENVKLSVPHPAISAIWITFMVGLVIWHSMSAAQYFCTLFTAPFACFPPTVSPYSRSASLLKKEWPPLFDNPLAATSIRDFWSHRWHSCFRRNFFITGAKPGAIVGESIGSLAGSVAEIIIPSGPTSSGMDSRKSTVRLKHEAKVLGKRVGGVMGVFLVSGLLHDFGMWGMGQGMDFRRVTGYFLIQGVGLIIENLLGLGNTKQGSNKQDARDSNRSAGNTNDDSTVIKAAQMTSSTFGYWLTKLWVILWVLLPATMMAEAWVQRGIAGVVLWPHSLSPARWMFRLWNQFAFNGRSQY
ncbi:TRI7-like toxin biosynthesis protein [Rhizoctonia solani AG-1 IB]|uniref:TRI7-like toxin biosynthesis protein n=1 Tax=Thanatephorus cucumeris (strain AG1-IB / isolate 7/3/14) TaxID=1108050 RepID=A0A0B7G422_THACB|nr:TRI7-like toxin biosynthesis protein [Rhizoctonia solani AG-1 IB]